MSAKVRIVDLRPDLPKRVALLPSPFLASLQGLALARALGLLPRVLRPQWNDVPGPPGCSSRRRAAPAAPAAPCTSSEPSHYPSKRVAGRGHVITSTSTRLAWRRCWLRPAAALRLGGPGTDGWLDGWLRHLHEETHHTHKGPSSVTRNLPRRDTTREPCRALPSPAPRQRPCQRQPSAGGAPGRWATQPTQGRGGQARRWARSRLVLEWLALARRCVRCPRQRDFASSTSATCAPTCFAFN